MRSCVDLQRSGQPSQQHLPADPQPREPSTALPCRRAALDPKALQVLTHHESRPQTSRQSINGDAVEAGQTRAPEGVKTIRKSRFCLKVRVRGDDAGVTSDP